MKTIKNIYIVAFTAILLSFFAVNFFSAKDNDIISKLHDPAYDPSTDLEAPATGHKQGSIQYSKYLPLVNGNKWVLHSDDWNLDFTYNITQLNDGIFLLSLDNPWITWDLHLFPLNDKVYLTRLMIGEDISVLGGYSLYFDFSSTEGTSIPLSMGQLTILEKNKTMTIGDTTYNDCTVLQLVASDGFSQTWTFAPEVGFIQFDFLGTQFKINTSKSTINLPENNDLPQWQTPVNKGNRLLGIDVNEAEDNNYPSAFEKSLDAGIQTIGFHLPWENLEFSPEQYEDGILSIVNNYFSSYGMGLSLTIAPIHNIMNNMPDDLKGYDLDAPIVIERFKKLLDFVASKLTDVELKNLIIGSEIDAFLQNDANKWQQYENFYREVADYARYILPDTNIATEFTFMGLLSGAKNKIISINKFSDVIGLSYYPRDLEGMVMDPEVVQRHFKSLVDIFPDKQIHFYQIGFPSSPLLNSSESLQAEFISSVFQAWDLHTDNIELIDFTFLHDLDEDEIYVSMAQFQANHETFVHFLATLGLREDGLNGTDKMAFSVLLNETTERGW